MSSPPKVVDLVDPPPTTTTTTVKTPVAAEDEQEEGATIDTFCEYRPTALPSSVIAVCNQNGSTDGSTCEKAVSLDVLEVPSHTSSACESALLASVPAPPADEQTATCIAPLLASGALSPLQGEGVLLAIQRHRRIFASGERAGFVLGDGAGIGKGRQIAALLRDAFSRQTTTNRHLWLSVSRELIQDARRDLTDVGVHCDVHDGTKLLSNKGAGLGKANKGVLFLTYPLLVSHNRLEQLIEWCADTSMSKDKRALEQAFTGCIVYDEAHKAKNLANDTKTAQLVLQLQRRLPKARVLYCSATGVSDVAHLAYAERLGLWNTKSISPSPTASTNNSISHFDDFHAFSKSLQSRGLGSLELLALELKQQGSFLARTLSWEGAEFQNMQIDLTPQQIQTYDLAVKWWTTLKGKLEKAIQRTDAPTMLWRNFWSAHQRFFKELAISAKVPTVAKDALQQIQQHDRCIVIGLQSTGESATSSLLEANHCKHQRLEDQQFPTLLSTCSAILTQFVQHHFPVTRAPPKLPTLPWDQPPAHPEQLQAYLRLQAEIARLQALPPPEPLPQLVEWRQSLLQSIGQLPLPPNPLDDLMDRLGGPSQVAEMTGRAAQMVRKGNHFVFQKRVSTASNNSAEESERINLVERRAFLAGHKAVAIISDAASTGISLHAAQGSGGAHKRRVHYTIELPWSADKAVQQLGRSHRSGQLSAPIYKLAVTTLGGERRFAAAVSKRMASLGALTKGDRRAATGSDMLSGFDLDSKYGKRALKKLYLALLNNEVHRTYDANNSQLLPSACLPSKNTKELLDQFVEANAKDPTVASLSSGEGSKYSTILSVATQELAAVGIEIKDKVDVRVFLNRLAGLTVARQGLVFQLFMSTLEDVIKEAKTTGEFEGTAEDLRATTIQIGSEEQVAIDPSCGVHTQLTTLVMDRGISFEAACAMAMEASKEKPAPVVSEEEEEEPPMDVQGEMDDFIVDDDDDEEDEWLDNAQTKDRIAKQGFYISKNKIAGRHLVLFAKHKHDRSSFQSEQAAASFDPFGLMVITRPNTGTNTMDMTSRDLQRKYRPAFSCDELKELVEAMTEEDGATVPTELVQKGCAEAANLWTTAYKESNRNKHHDGYAPRIANVALVTGPVLHIMPALEKAVLMRPEKERALKIMRAQVGSRQIVGVRFPSDHQAIHDLKEELKKLREDRKTAGNTFVDEALSPICQKSMDWATTERKTMKSFFQVAAECQACHSSPRSRREGHQIKDRQTQRFCLYQQGIVQQQENQKADILLPEEIETVVEAFADGGIAWCFSTVPERLPLEATKTTPASPTPTQRAQHQTLHSTALFITFFSIAPVANTPSQVLTVAPKPPSATFMLHASSHGVVFGSAFIISNP